MDVDGAESLAAARPSSRRISSVALPSPESSSLAPLEDADEPSVYVYEGRDYKELTGASLERVDEELESSAAAGERALQRMHAAAQAEGDAEWEGGYESPEGGSKKRKSLEQLQETAEERAVRLQRNKDLAQRRAESARKKREEAEAAREAALQEKWATHDYASTSIHLDEALQAALEASSEAAPLLSPESQAAAGEEWGVPDEAEEPSASQRKAKLTFVVGDATRPFVFQREDGREGTTHDVEVSACAAASSSAASIPSSSSALVFVPVDASGRWGKGGLFRALDNRSSLPGAQYELMGARWKTSLWGTRTSSRSRRTSSGRARRTRLRRSTWRSAWY